MKKRMRCNFSRCTHSGTRLCRTCKTVAYCSELCQSKDLHCHIEICSASQSERIKKMCDLAVLYDYGDDDEVNLSCIIRIDSPIYDGERHNLCAFKYRDSQLSYSNTRYCGVCAIHTARYPAIDGYFSYKNKKIRYERCLNCLESGALLCSNTFLETSNCATLHKRVKINAIHIILYRAYIIYGACLNADIMSIILSQLIGSIQCLDCIQIK